MALYKTLVRKISIPPDKKTKQKDYLKHGKLAIIDQGQQLIGGYSDIIEKQLICELPVIVFGDHSRAVKYVTFPFGAGADGIKVLEPKETVLPKYLYYGTQYLVLRLRDHGYARHYQFIEKMELPVVPIPEQERIVARIEELFSQLDASVSELKTAKERLKVYRQAVLKEAFKECSTWDRYLLVDLMDSVKNGYSLKPTDRGEYRILKISAVRPMKLDINECRYNEEPLSQEYLIEENDLLFTRYNGSREFVGVCACVPKLPCLYGYPDKLIKCTPKLKNNIHTKYLQYYMSQGDARKYIRSKIKTTSGQNGVSGNDIKNTVIYLPNISEQEKVVTKIEARLSVCDCIEKTVDTALQQAEAMRQSILKKSFEGGL